MNLPEAVLAALLLGFGTARATAIISIDAISEPLRDLVFHYFPPEDDDALGYYYQGMNKVDDETRKRRAHWNVPWWQKRWETTGPLRKPSFIGRVIQCHICLAVWIAAGNTALFLLWEPGALVLNLFLAAAHLSAALNHNLHK